jgi:hypothetical protein
VERGLDGAEFAREPATAAELDQFDRQIAFAAKNVATVLQAA